MGPRLIRTLTAVIGRGHEAFELLMSLLFDLVAAAPDAFEEALPEDGIGCPFFAPVFGRFWR